MGSGGARKRPMSHRGLHILRLQLSRRPSCTMSLNFLSRVATSPLPYQVTDHLELLHVDVLMEAGVIAAIVSGADGGLGRKAVIHAITPKGRELLQKIHSLRAKDPT